MKREPAIGSRVLVTLITNLGRHGLTLATGILIARTLGPLEYGHYAFLIGSFVAVKGFLDLSTSHAFYTFICAERRTARFFAYYGAWLLCQFALALALILMVAPDPLIALVWGDHARPQIALAFVAVFAQQSVWNAVVQTGESARMTFRVQMAGVAVAAVNFGGLAILAALAMLSPTAVYSLTAVNFILAALLVLASARSAVVAPPGETPVSLRATVRHFAAYVLPLLPTTILSAAAQLTDTWLLQHFGGPEEQAYFALSMQYLNVALLLTWASLNVLWKEFTAAASVDDMERLHRLSLKGQRLLFAVASALALFLTHWADEVMTITVGSAYGAAGAVFAVVLLNAPIQSLCQVHSVTLMARQKTRELARLTLGFLLASVPAAVALLAVMDLGAIGMAGKFLGTTLFFLLLMELHLFRTLGWRPDFGFRLKILVIEGGLGWGAHAIAGQFLPQNLPAVMVVAAGGALFALMHLPLLPWLASQGLSLSSLRSRA